MKSDTVYELVKYNDALRRFHIKLACKVMDSFYNAGSVINQAPPFKDQLVTHLHSNDIRPNHNTS